jgi:hypothetical protein
MNSPVSRVWPPSHLCGARSVDNDFTAANASCAIAYHGHSISSPFRKAVDRANGSRDLSRTPNAKREADTRPNVAVAVLLHSQSAPLLGLLVAPTLHDS